MLIDGHKVYRRDLRCKATDEPWPVWFVDPVVQQTHTGRVRRTIGWTSPGESDRHRFRVLAHEYRCPEPDPPPQSPAAEEAAKLRALGFGHLADRLGAAEYAPPEGLFSAGAIHRARVEGINWDVALEAIGRHVAGDLGELGRVDSSLVTEAVAFCPWAAETAAARASASVAAGCGPVLSRHRVGKLTVDVLTVLHPAGNMTAVLPREAGAGFVARTLPAPGGE